MVYFLKHKEKMEIFNKKFVNGFDIYVKLRNLYKNYDETMENHSVFFLFPDMTEPSVDPFQWMDLLDCIKESVNSDLKKSI